jgi:hypothetical protein
MLQLLIVMSALTKPEITRQLLMFRPEGTPISKLEDVSALVTRDEYDLKLDDITKDMEKCESSKVRIYVQHNTKASRKQVQPLFDVILSKI